MGCYVTYDIATGEALSCWQDGDGSPPPTPEEGTGVLRVPRKALLAPGIDLDAIRDAILLSVDQEADTVRSKFLTNTPGQMATYIEKEAEARQVLAGGTDPTVFLDCEAEAIGISVAELAQEVVAQADLWRPIGARIEAARRKAKVELGLAANLATLAEARQIDWQTVITPDA